jgi:fatty-acyl-CoA synthase
VIDAACEEVWEIVSDLPAWDSLLANATRWEHAGGPERGLGARYQLRLKVASAEVGSLIEFVEWDEPADLAWTGVTGLDQRGRWRLRETDDGRTKATLRLSYQAPGGLLAMTADRISSPIVASGFRETLERLKRKAEGDRYMGDGKRDGGVLDEVTSRVEQAVVTVRTAIGAGMVRPIRPDKIVRSLMAVQRWGYTPATGYIANAVRFPDEDAIIDDLGRLTFAEVQDRTNRLASSLADAGVLEGDGVAIMCRNHRYFVESVVALSKLGAHALFLNTAFAGPQLTEVVKREKPVAVIYDEEFTELLEDAGKRRKRFLAWTEEEGEQADPTLEELIENGDPTDLIPPEESGRTVILTSGTTGTPKGASRKQAESIGPAIALLSRIPLKTHDRSLIAAPLFHSWGFAHFTLGMALSHTLVLQRRFKPELTLAGIAQHQAHSCPMVPVMVQRIMDLPEETRTKYDLSSLRAIPLSGSALPGELAIRFMDEFGDILYNLYGSTEVAWATIATPEDLRAAPGTAGKPPIGTTLRIYDENGNELPPGREGRIFVANEMLFEGYTGGGSKDVIDGLMATGDVGYIDEELRLFVSGRDDEMIVSGGENVFPREVEDTISNMKGISEVAIIGVDDEEWGQRLKAFVVTQGNSGPSEDEIKKHVKSNLAGYKVPREVEFMKELPRNATGKVLKRELQEQEEEAGSKK